MLYTETEEVLGDGQVVTGVKAKNRATGEVVEIPATGFFVAIGLNQTPIFLPELYYVERNGLYRKCSGSLKQMFRSVFVAGDTADHVYRQAITAAGTGCISFRCKTLFGGERVILR